MAPPPWRTLVEPATLHGALGRVDLVLLDCRHALTDPAYGPAAHARSHLPGALHAHVDRDLSSPPRQGTGRHPLPDADDFRAACSRWGIAPTTQVVAYDDQGGTWASRLWWLLHDYGHEASAVLDGGLPAWAALGLPLEQGPPAPRAPTRFAGRPGHMPAVSAWDLRTRAPRRLLDARAPERYRGEAEPIDPIAGHIVGAVNMPTGGNLLPDGRFLPPEALRARYAPVLEAWRGKDAAAYCGSGVTATHDILAIAHAGLGTIALYPGSWSEWIRDPTRPVAKGPEP